MECRSRTWRALWNRVWRRAKGQNFLGGSRRSGARDAVSLRGGVREKTADFFWDLGGAGGQAAKEFQRAGCVGPQLGLFYEIASGGAVKVQNFLGARAEAALALVVSLGGGHAAKG